MEARKEYRDEERDEDDLEEDRDEHVLNEDKDAFRGSEIATDEAVDTLLPDDEGTAFRGRWEDVQASFVDEPRKAVQAADRLVAEVTQRLAESFAQERSALEEQWDRGEDVSTEDLRVALQRYRSFFQRLLAA
jgi:D-alanyl-D-alanine carboxypeptidase